MKMNKFKDKIHPKILKKAKILGLKIFNYEGYSVGGWGCSEYEAPIKGMWVFSVSPIDGCCDDEDGCIVAENLNEVMEEMESLSAYFKS